MIKKPLKIRSKKLRDSARDQACLLRLPEVCNGDWQTTVLAHVNFGGHGMGTKESDLSACYACSSCHDALDGRIPWARDEAVVFRAVMTTLHKLVDAGLIKVAA